MVLGSWNPQIHYLSFSGPNMDFSSSKTLRFKGKTANFEPKNSIKLGKKAKRTNGTHFTRVQGRGAIYQECDCSTQWGFARKGVLKRLGHWAWCDQSSTLTGNIATALLACGQANPWKSKFLYRYRPEGIFRIFFGLILDPRRYTCFYSKKRQIHLYRPFFSPWHGLFRKKGGTGAGIRFYFP